MNRLIDFLDRDRSTRRQILFLGLILLVAYGGSVVASLTGDDLMLMRNARNASWSLSDLSQSFLLQATDWTDGWLPAQLSKFRLFFFRPVCMASFKLDHAIWGTWVPGYHLTNILLQAIVVLLVFRWGSDLGLDRRSSFLMTVFYILYVPNIMAVNWIAGRTEIMAAMFILTSIIFLGKFYQTKKPLHYVISFAACLGAMGTKENSVMIPFMHALAAAFLYRPTGHWRTGLRTRALAIAPFFLLLPPYFALRSSVLSGFPVPPKGFYYHPIADSDFPVFLLAKLAHAVLSLVYQIPTVAVPSIIERSAPLLALLVVIAVATAFLVIRAIPSPQRYFLLGWMALTLAPTLPIGLNPIYYYLCSPLIAFVYVHLYRRYAASRKPWQAKVARGVLAMGVGFGLIVSAFSGFAFRANAQVGKHLAMAIMGQMKAHPEAETIFVLDMTASALYTVPEIRYADETTKDKNIVILSLSAGMLNTIPSDFLQVDEYSFEARPRAGTYLSTGLEQIVLAQDIIPFEEGMTVEHEAYSIEVVEVSPQKAHRPESSFVQALRSHFRLPDDEQLGVRALRFRFQEPLDSANYLFLRADGPKVYPVEFRGMPLTDRAPSGEN